MALFTCQFFQYCAHFFELWTAVAVRSAADFTALGSEISFTHWYQKVLMVKK
jgi:hypothetical protein